MKLNRTEKDECNLWATLMIIMNFLWWGIFIMEIIKLRALVTIVAVILYVISGIILTCGMFTRKQLFQRLIFFIAIISVLAIGILVPHIIEWVLILL